MRTLILVGTIATLCACSNPSRDAEASVVIDSTGSTTDTLNVEPVIETNSVSVQMVPLTGKYCYISAVQKSGDHIIIKADAVDFLMGDAAVAAARADGEADFSVESNGDTSWHVADDYYIRNSDTRTSHYRLAKDFVYTVSTVGAGGGMRNEVALAYLQKQAAAGTLFVLTFKDGIVTQITEQFLP